MNETFIESLFSKIILVLKQLNILSFELKAEKVNQK